jgi:hypothetical protein
MTERVGLIALFGSGETSANGRKVYEWVFSRLPATPRVALLETPAGFQPNSQIVAQKIADFLKTRLQNYRPETTVIPARRRGSPLGTDDPDLLAAMLRATVLFMGPGSPTYTVRHLKESLAWEYLRAKHRVGTAVLLASAATIAAGAHCLPVYEIYKVGEDPHWQTGLDLLGAYGLSLTFVPHWDNSEGGAELDTSRCFMGEARFRSLLTLLPTDTTVVGIDEHTALVVDIDREICRVMGRGGVTLLRDGMESRYRGGQSFPMNTLGPFRTPPVLEGVSQSTWSTIAKSEGDHNEQRQPGPSAEALALLETRREARDRRDWLGADALRTRLEEMGWRVVDTPEDSVLERIKPA